MTDNTQPEALRLAQELDEVPETGGDPDSIQECAAELRRQHTRIAELEAQLESIGAGGVNGPLMGQPQAMPDLSQLKERGAKAWAGVDAQGLRAGRWYMVNKDGMATLCADEADAQREAADAQAIWPGMGPHSAVQLVDAGRASLQSSGFSAEDMATAGAQGFRDGVASLSANAGEPTCDMRTVVAVAVTMLYDTHPEDVCRVFDRNDLETIVSITEPLGHGRVEDIYRDAWDHVAAPPTAQAEGWTKLPGQLPEPGMPVLLDIGKEYPIRAMWAAKHTVQAADDDTDWGEYVEADDMYYAPKGWYEWNQCEDNHWRVTETPRAWMPIPPTSAEGVEHG